MLDNSKDNQTPVPVEITTIEDVDTIDGETFQQAYVNKRIPVIIKGVANKWPAVNRWNIQYFSLLKDDINLPIKMGDVSKGEKKLMRLTRYAELLINYEEDHKANSKIKKPPYLHDVPIFLLIPELKKDIHPFPVEYFPSWYHNQWWRFVQFFMGSTNSLTPLHFDTLYTHNLFFQISGEKKFYLVKEEDRGRCYMKNWRWSRVDLENPDYARFPLLREVQINQAIVGPGDILYMPAGTLHQVHGLSTSISFNIDWHTRKSVLYGLFSGLRGAPWKNVYYNFIVALGLYLGIPSNRLFSFYQSYLNHVS